MLHVNYFNAELSEMHKITYIFFQTDGSHFVFCVEFQSTHNIQGGGGAW